LFDIVTQDVRYGIRQLVRAPLFTVVAALSLGIGITVAVTVFSLLNSVLFKRLPVPQPDAVVHVFSSDRVHDLPSASSYADLADYQRSGAFSAVAAHLIGWSATVAANDRTPQRAGIGFVSPNFFQALGLQLEGRSFNLQGAESEIVISEQYRRRTFGSARNVVGAIVRVNNMPLTVVGVAPAAFRGFRPGLNAIGWIPAQQMRYVLGSKHSLDDRGERSFGMIGRLAPGLTREAATARLGNTARVLAGLYPDHWRHHRGAPLRIVLQTQRETIIRPDDRSTIAALATVTALVLMVLILACTNVAGLLLARAITRRHEVAVRLTLGASRARLMSQLLIEALLLAGIGGAVGFAGAQAAIRLAARNPVFDSFDLAPDWRVLGVTGMVSLFCAVIFGLTPAGQSLRQDVKAGLSGHGVVGQRAGVRGRLIALQVCLSCLLMLIAFSATRGVRSKLGNDRGFELNGLLLIQLDFGGFRSDTIRKSEYIDAARSTLRLLPGVQHLTVAMSVPFSRTDGGPLLDVALPGGRMSAVRSKSVSDGYFETLGIKVLRGRTLTVEDTQAAGSVVVVNRAFSDLYGGDVLGSTITVSQDRRVQIVGIVDDVQHGIRDERGMPYLYEARKQSSWKYSTMVYLIARVRPDLAQVVATQTMRTLRDRYPDAVPPNIEPLRSSIERSMAPQRVIANIALGIGATEMMLATIGLYSLLLYALLSRSREIGLRMALGARSHQASYAVIADGLRFVGAGAIMGLVLCVPAAMFAGRNFIGASATDPIPFLFVLLTIVLSSAAAAYIPARRAARIQPMSALRHE
jgi:predicted permease